VYRVEFDINRDKEEEMTHRLFDAGAQSVSVEEEDETGIKMTGIFDRTDMLAQQFPGCPYMVTELEEMSWKYRWLEYFKGTELTGNIFVEPAGYSSPARHSYTHVMQLDPRDAFGDGAHPTTRMCAHMLEKYLDGIDEDEKSRVHMLDVGTGTGILAIAAFMTGIKNVEAFDIEEDSVTRARENARRNNCGEIRFFRHDLAEYRPGKKFPLVTANLLTFIVENNMDTLADLLQPGGTMILSGIGKKWEHNIRELFQLHGFQVVEAMEDGRWKGFMLKHK